MPEPRTPICAECHQRGDTVTIRFVPASGFGSRGEWQHAATPPHPGHQPRPHLFIDPPLPKQAATEQKVPHGFLGC